MKILQLFLILILIYPVSVHSQPGSNSGWEYFGQHRPELIPEIFAPGIISGKGRIHCFPAFSSDNKEIYWMLIPPKILYSSYVNNRWTDPIEADFAKDILCLRPIFSHNNQRIYFASNLPDGFGNLDIWYIEKTDTGFSRPVNIGAPVNTDKFEAQQTFTSEGTIYYNGYIDGKRFNRGILRAKIENGNYLTPEIIEYPINILDTNAIDYTPFIAKDESFLLFSSNRHNTKNEDCRIFISFRDNNDNWSEPVNINKIMDFDYDSRDPYISPDDKYLFFSSGENIYWISSKIIAKIKDVFK